MSPDDRSESHPFRGAECQYVCCMIEYTARKTKNRRGKIAEQLGTNGIRRQLEYASVNHSLSLEQVSDEWIEDYSIQNGDFDTVAECRYEVPSVTSIGNDYRNLVESISDDIPAEEKIFNVFSSCIVDSVSGIHKTCILANEES